VSRHLLVKFWLGGDLQMHETRREAHVPKQTGQTCRERKLVCAVSTELGEAKLRGSEVDRKKYGPSGSWGCPGLRPKNGTSTERTSYTASGPFKPFFGLSGAVADYDAP
jgi:hypothetical protein